ncbi:MAG: DUF4255 domain-containing protein [Nitrosomonas sp.]|nr:DUF4255 domain-containing protein [Nitrosomonas sp.]
MIHALTATLKNILADQDSVPEIVRNANVTFERPTEPFKPGTATINLFLYDIRENPELRNNEQTVERLNGIATIRKPPLRLDCSYQVTAWVDSSSLGEQAILSEQELLSEALRVFARTPIIEGKYLQGEVKQTQYPISLKTAQTDLMRNPAEFWSALGGKLKPSVTITATIALDQDIKPVEQYLVSSKKVTVGEKRVDSNDYKNSSETVTGYEIAGIVADTDTGAELENVELTITETGQLALTDESGRYRFGRLKEGKYTVRAVKSGYAAITHTVSKVPGTSSTAFDIKLKRSST